MILQGQEDLLNGIHYEVNPNEPALGEGATGIVRRGVMVDEKTGIRREVAIKFLFSDLSDNAIERSRREATIHIVNENLVEMIGFVQVGKADLYGKANVHYHVVSELLRGVMLLDMLHETVPDQVYETYPKVKEFHEDLLANRNVFALNVVRGVLSGIMALHDNGYIHRDIDPSNVMITEQGKVKLIDLGICKRLGNIKTASENLTSQGQFIGKACYAAPELVRGDLAHQDQTTDIYAIGIMLYQIITGSLPFQGPIQDVLEKQIKESMPLQNINNRKVRDIIRKATEKKRNDRFRSASEFRVAIDSVKDIGQVDSSSDSDKIIKTVAVLMSIGSMLGIVLGFIL